MSKKLWIICQRDFKLTGRLTGLHSGGPPGLGNRGRGGNPNHERHMSGKARQPFLLGKEAPGLKCNTF